ncbi:hypothetical protein [Filimonas effusa]|uniref:Uncharacterized protein n=1 Tax=Filimonas effusa TaxID=2508721 RepID=A0A4Q1D5G4_9BACT|nr:hypothetical protein [Filimonas effusa]RXK82891.1 hypothetical protein ESB13_12235 [Filimonas effusa]
MQQLPNNCRAGKMSVFPKNWNTVKANINLKWYIKYRFYDDNLNKSRQVVLKGMNMLTRLAEKQAAVRIQLKDEQDMLDRGYNPITGSYHENTSLLAIQESEQEIEEDLQLPSRRRRSLLRPHQ